MANHYTHLSVEERAVIQAELELGFGPRAIARGLGRAPSTITRELRRNGWSAPAFPRGPGRPALAGGYRAPAAHARARTLAGTARVPRKLVPGNALWGKVMHLLGRGLSPEQVGRTLARMPEPARISHETIYRAIYLMPRGELRAIVIRLLRRSPLPHLLHLGLETAKASIDHRQ
ncbi:MAG: helix-turn-helix domain-containing protein [Acidobacteria bacterium]|nr:helix-turn-helix domain-containing protein [Acidobacteriota bacterium]